MRFWLIAFIVLLSGCATLDNMKGSKSFKAFTGSVEIGYIDKDILSLSINGHKVANILPIGRGASWTDISRWEGAYQNSYLYVQCGKAHWRTGERECDVKQVKQCSWNISDNRCSAYAVKEAVQAVVVGAPATVYKNGDVSRLVGNIKENKVTLNFDNKPIAQIPTLTILESSKNTSLYQGKLGEDKAEVFCKAHRFGYNNYQVPTIVCAAHKYINGRSGRGFQLAKIGEAVIPWNLQDYTDTQYLANRFYVVSNWPRLNPNQPKELPKPNAKKSKYALLLEKEWMAWIN